MIPIHTEFSQGTLQTFRERLIAHDMDRRLLERTVELANLFDLRRASAIQNLEAIQRKAA